MLSPVRIVVFGDGFGASGSAAEVGIPSTPGKDVKPETVADATLAAQGADGKDFIGRRFVC